MKNKTFKKGVFGMAAAVALAGCALPDPQRAPVVA